MAVGGLFLGIFILLVDSNAARDGVQYILALMDF
jgi:hypothetical protein